MVVPLEGVTKERKDSDEQELNVKALLVNLEFRPA